MPDDNDNDFNADQPRDGERRDRGDRPRRDRRDDRDRYGEPPENPQVSVLGLLSLFQGMGSLIASFIPCVGVLAIGGGAVGLLLGVIGWVAARGSNGRTGIGLPVAGVVVNGLAIIIGGCWLLFMTAMFKDAGNRVNVDPGPGLEITASALDKEYAANELEADGKYMGKVLVVTGKVLKVTRDDKPGKITVELVGTPGSTVDCHFDRAKQAELAGVAVGQEVTVRGTCKGKVRTWVTLEDCALGGNPADKVDPKDAPPPLAVTADELERAYDANVVSADAKYKGKPLELTGRVERVVRNKPGVVTLEIETDAGDTIDCDFTTKDAQAALKDVAPGDAIVLRGTCRGYSDDNGITLDKCTFVKKADAPKEGAAVAVTAEELAKAYASNVVAADAKYKGKLLEVSGKVLRVGKLQANKFAVELGSGGRLSAVCNFQQKDGQAQLGSVSKGDAVVIRGTCRGGGDGLPLLENCTLVKE